MLGNIIISKNYLMILGSKSHAKSKNIYVLKAKLSYG